MMAAGGVVKSFGEFVAGDKIVVGLIIFVIIVVIQFVVITKGATRISEVAARFALDGMPGRQMAIDADLNAGIIDEREAQRRRLEITQQADFFGAMDGASKFVRGDAIAGIIITLINIVGGLVIGVVESGMDDRPGGRAVHQADDRRRPGEPGAGVLDFAGRRLAGHARSSGDTNLPAQFLPQLFSRPQALAVTGAFVGVLVFTSLPDGAAGGDRRRLHRPGHDARRGSSKRGRRRRANQSRRPTRRNRPRSGSKIIWRSIRWRSRSAWA